jgi:SprT protein
MKTTWIMVDPIVSQWSRHGGNNQVNSAWLDSYIPRETTPLISRWLDGHSLTIQLKRPRRSKLGDFRAASGGKAPCISVNIDLRPHQFLVTLTHEIAHFLNWSENGRFVAPHGPQWKACFGRLLTELSTVSTLPDALRAALRNHAGKPKSATHYDQAFATAIAAADGDETLRLDDIPTGGFFKFRERLFRKIKSNRTRCRCIEVNTRIEYRISRIAPVDAVTLDPHVRIQRRISP